MAKHKKRRSSHGSHTTGQATGKVKDKGMLMGTKGQRVPFGEEVQERHAKISMITRQVDVN